MTSPHKTSQYYKTNNIYLGDCIDLMKNIPAGFCDLVITDPPFAIDFKKTKMNYNRKDKNVLEGYCDIKSDKYYDFTISWMTQAKRILKNTGAIYIFSGWNNLKDILNALDVLKFTVINHIIWKYQFGVFTKKRFVTSHYHLLYAVMNPKKYTFNKIDHYPEDVWVINREYWTNKEKTPTKLPIALVEKIINYSSMEGELVFDPFLGSGTVAAAAKKLGRAYMGFEIVEKYFEFARRRIDNT